VASASSKTNVDHSVICSKEVGTLEQIKQMSKLTHAEGAESTQQKTHQAQCKEISGKVPYCFRCKTKGLAIESCFATMHCDICDSKDHFKPRCPKFRATKLGAVHCGYAVEGLGFSHIPIDIVSKNGIEARSALIRVTESELSAQGVVAELQRLIPGD
jgi:hypothetical protein